VCFRNCAARMRATCACIYLPSWKDSFPPYLRSLCACICLLLCEHRFLPGSTSTVNQFTFTPFGGGPHKCLGAQLAFLVTKAFLSIWLARWDWEVRCQIFFWVSDVFFWGGVAISVTWAFCLVLLGLLLGTCLVQSVLGMAFACPADDPGTCACLALMFWNVVSLLEPVPPESAGLPTPLFARAGRRMHCWW
jgi:Cytochrome P450